MLFANFYNIGQILHAIKLFLCFAAIQCSEKGYGNLVVTGYFGAESSNKKMSLQGHNKSFTRS